VTVDDLEAPGGLKQSSEVQKPGNFGGVEIGTTVFAEGVARGLVEPLGRRWSHVEAVAACAVGVAPSTGLDPDVLVSAAWLHDIGYAPELAATGFHPLDGARHLRHIGVDERVVRLVAHHSSARVEARLRGMEDEFWAEFPAPEPEYEDALCYCDMTTGPSGDRVDAQDRLNEIRERYGPGHVVTRFVDEAEDEILAMVRRVEERMALSGSRGSGR